MAREAGIDQSGPRLAIRLSALGQYVPSGSPDQTDFTIGEGLIEHFTKADGQTGDPVDIEGFPLIVIAGLNSGRDKVAAE